MPYIDQTRREEINGNLEDPRTAGELNYLLTLTCLQYWENHGQSYQCINDIVGALEGCKLEFYRRLVVPYENLKIISNSDVYPEA